MPFPIMTDKDDVDAIITYLKKRPFGVTIEEAKATIETKLLDGRKMNAYRTWDLITDNNDKLVLTQRGREYSQASEAAKKDIYGAILSENNVYKLTLEWIGHRKFDQLPANDVAVHWSTHFRVEIGTETEQSLNNQVVCFMNLAEAAGLGEYKVGRGGQPTRLEVNKVALKTFIEKFEEENHSTVKNDENETKSKEKAENTTAQNNVPPSNIPLNYDAVQPAQSTPFKPSLHIDIQIHIASDTTPDQIDKIFESMAKHLYKNSNE